MALGTVLVLLLVHMFLVVVDSQGVSCGDDDPVLEDDRVCGDDMASVVHGNHGDVLVRALVP